MTTSLRSNGFIILRGIAYSAAFVSLWAWLALSVRSFDAGIPVVLPPWLRPLGVVLATLGALLAGVCIATFLTTGRGTPAPFDAPREFVASGPYRYVRNPMYVGAGVLIVGVGLILSSPSVLLLALGFIFAMHLFVVLYEEPVLALRFGESYEQYRSTVHRWLIQKPKPSPREVDPLHSGEPG